MHANLRRNILLFLAGLLAAFVGWRVGPGSVPAPSSNVGRGRLVFPGLAAKLPTVARIAIESGGKTIVLLPRPGQKHAPATWGLEERGLYPVRTGKLRSVLSGLTLLRQVSPRTADPTLYSRIGVEDPATAGGSSTGISLFDAKGKLVAALIVGHQRVRAAGGLPPEVYIRRPGHRRSWLAEGALTIDADPQLWLQRGIVDIAPGRIASVSVHRGATALRFVAHAGKLVLVSPATHPPLDAFKLDDLASALQALTLNDVAPASAEPGKPVGHSVFRTSDGLAITVHLFRDGPHLWAQFQASGKGAAPLAARLDGWTYQLGTWMERQLVPTLAELAPTPSAGAAAIPPAKAAPAAHPAATGATTPGAAGHATAPQVTPAPASPASTTTHPTATAPAPTPGKPAPSKPAPGTTPGGKGTPGGGLQGKAGLTSPDMEAAARPGTLPGSTGAQKAAAAAAAAVAAHTGR
ncbi:MAG: DUF4340 domain-containing protein [Rhodospirillales bacterium]|nr:DUF4340 domain-containing protein [Rhodospirillales bacterium]